MSPQRHRPAQDRPLQDRVVAVTGAARGIGLTLARELVERGARVAMSDVDAAALRAAAAEVGAALALPLDVTDADAFEAFLAEVEERLGPLDALVNNAGIMPTGRLVDEPDALTRTVLEVNTFAMIIGTKKAAARMIPRGSGHIVNVSSTMGLTPVPGLATYNASKAALVLFGETMAAELAPSGIQVSTVLPAAVNTELTAGLSTTASITIPVLRRTITVASPIEPIDVALAIVAALESGVGEPRLLVPAALGRVFRLTDLLSPRTRRRLSAAMGVNRQILDGTDDERRSGYLARVRAGLSGQKA